MTTIAEVRQQYPDLAPLDDDQVVDVLHGAFYADMPREAIAQRLGVKEKAPKVEPSSTARRVLGDTAVSLGKGVIAVPEAAVGIADLATGGRAGKLAEEVGFRPKEAKAMLDELYSPEQQAANAEVANAKGFVDTAGAVMRNPSTIWHSVVESAPSMVGGGAFGGLARRALPRMSAVAAGAAGEGVMTAGSQAEAIRQETGDGLLTPQQSALAAGSGALTGALGGLSGRVARALGIKDIDTVLAGGAGPDVQKALVRRVLEGAFTEGILEELPQSVQEQVAQNAALGKPLDEGVAQGAVLGMLAGGAMGAGAQVLHRPGDAIRADRLPDSGPMSRAANAGIDQQAAMADAGVPPPMNPEEEARTQQAEQQAAADAQAQADDDAARTPIFSTMVNDVRTALGDPETMAAVRERFGTEGTTQLLNSLNQATNPKIPEGVRKKHLEAVQEAMLALNARPIPNQQKLPTRAAAGAPRLEGAPAPLAIELDTSPTGTIRVDSEGRAVPEMRADAISTKAALEERDSLGTGVPRGEQYTVPPAAAPATAAAPKPDLLRAAPPAASAVAEPAPAPSPTAAEPAEQPARQGTFSLAEEAHDYISRQRRAASARLPPALPRQFEDGSFGVVTEGSDGFEEASAQQRQREHAAAGIRPDDVLTKSGNAFKTKMAANLVAKKQGGEVVEVTGGWVVRKAAVEPAAPAPAAAPTVDAEAIHAKAQEAATSPTNDLPEPTQAQKEAGNYRKGHITLHGLDISIENPAGSVRRGVDRDGKPWENTLRHHYGYFRGTVGNDKDHVDTFVGPDPASTRVFIVDQVHPDTGKFDEHKVVLGAGSIEQAREIYQSNYAKDWKGLHAISEMPIDEFRSWVKDGPKTKPIAGPIKAAPSAAPPASPAEPTTLAEAEAHWDAVKDSGDTQAMQRATAAVVRLRKQEAAAAADVPPAAAVVESAPAAAAAPEAQPVAAASTVTKRRTAPAKPVKEEAAAPAPSAAPAPTKIEDFGEKLHGARKDYAALLKEAAAVDSRAEPLSKSWPEPDYQKLLDAGTSPKIVAAIRAARDQVGTKPQVSWRLDGWVKEMQALRDAAAAAMAGKTLVEWPNNVNVRLKTEFEGRAALYEEFGHGKSLKGVTIAEHHFAVYRGERNVRKWVIEQAAKATAFSHWPRELAVGNTREEVLAQFREKLATVDLGAKAKGQPQFELYGKRGTPGAFIGKKIGREYIDLKKFDDVKAARAYLTEHLDELETALAKYRETPYERREDNQPRVGDDHRSSAAMTPEVFARTFGFRGVQFGNYVEQGRRQSDLNEAFDALMDMAAVLNLPPRALSLNGQLGLAFGARGRGGKNAPAAHYEPGQVVINLTKGGGPGSLGHEWWHAVDNYFAKQSGEGGFVTGGAKAASLRAQMAAAFKAVTTATQAPTLRRRAAELDKRRTTPYWNTPIELSARAFESYLIAKLQDQQAANDYLANVVSEEVWGITEAARAEFLGGSNEPSYPYPGQAELPAVRAAFDEFFRTVETKESDEGHIAMFSRTRRDPVATLTGSEIAGAVPKAILRARAMAYGEREFSGKSFHNASSDTDIEVTRAGLKHALSNANEIEVRLLAALGQLLERATLVETVPDRLGRPDVKSVQRYEAAVKVGDETLGVGVIVRELKDGHRFYDHFVLKDESPGGISEATSDGDQSLGDQPALGDAGSVPDPDSPALSRSGTAGGARVSEVRELADMITSRWANPPEVVVVNSINDPQVPDSIVRLDAQQLSQGADGVPAGFYHGGKVYLVASELDGDSDVVKVLFHEGLGHYGLRGAFGQTLGTILDRLAILNAGKVRAKAREYGLDYDNLTDRRAAAEEVLADMAQTHPELGFVKRVVAAIRTWLREHVPKFKNKEFSDDEIIRSFILPARAFVQSARPSDRAFADTEPMAMFSRASTAAQNLFLDATTGHGTVNWWQRSVGTQYHKAQQNPATFGKVFNALQDYIKDISVYANAAADKAPTLLQKLDSWRDLKRSRAAAVDVAAAGKAIFEGTLNDKKVYARAELTGRFGLTDKQVELYGEFRGAVDQSLDDMAKSELVRLVGEQGSVLAGQAMSSSLDEAAEMLADHMEAIGDERTAGAIKAKAAQVAKLQEEGYAPLMRFGQHTLHITRDGETEYFAMFESRLAANRAARQLRDDPAFQGAEITHGLMSEQAHKLFSALPLDSLELFAHVTGNTDDQVYQDFLKLTKSNRSAMKRMIHRQGVAGYSEDVTRVLASFLTSNARLAAGNLHLGAAKQAAQAIPKEQGDLKDEAVRLVEYVQNPQEEASALRGLLFTNFIGGSVASAAVNLTQPLTMTLPYLSQFGGAVKAGARLLAAAKVAATGRADGELADALRRAEADGIVSPQEIHHLQAEAMGRLGNNPLLKKAAFIWGSLFSLSEQFNRRVSFIAAYRTALAENIADPDKFAEKAVIETQGLYNKGNKANWGRGAIGATAMTFKQFSTHYLEFLTRMYKSGPEGKRAVAVALAMLLLAGGAGGLPFADDLDDLVDTLAQALGYDFNSKVAKRKFIAETLGLGSVAGEVATRGLSSLPGMPIDVSLRMGMGNLLPGTGLLLRSNTDRSSDVLELAGAAGGLAKNAIEGGQKVLQGDVLAGVGTVVPVAIQNLVKATTMWQTGEYRNTKGQKVMDVDAVDAVMKGIGFQPAEVARESARMQQVQRSVALAKNVESEIAGAWAQAQADGDAEGVQKARKQLATWNEDNPGTPIRITGAQIVKRVRDLKASRADRAVKSAPKELRGMVRETLG